MARTVNKKKAKVKEPPQQSKASVHDRLAFAVDSEQAVIEKDEAELELEKLVFGDDVGFREGLKSYNHDDGSPISSEVLEEDQQGPNDENSTDGEGLEGIDDADVSNGNYEQPTLFLTYTIIVIFP